MFSFFLCREFYFFICYLYFNYILVKCNAPYNYDYFISYFSLCLYFTAELFFDFFSFFSFCLCVCLIIIRYVVLFPFFASRQIFVFFNFFPSLLCTLEYGLRLGMFAFMSALIIFPSFISDYLQR